MTGQLARPATTAHSSDVPTEVSLTDHAEKQKHIIDYRNLAVHHCCESQMSKTSLKTLFLSLTESW